MSPDTLRWAVLAASQHLPRTRCLPRALVLEALLRQAGIDADLRIGVAKTPARGLVAHAWVECGDQPVWEGERVTAYAALTPALAARRPTQAAS